MLLESLNAIADYGGAINHIDFVGAQKVIMSYNLSLLTIINVYSHTLRFKTIAFIQVDELKSVLDTDQM